MEMDFVLSEDETEGYTPLERPLSNHSSGIQSSIPQEIVYSDDDNQNCSSSYDSDEAHTQITKKKLKRKASVFNSRADSNPVLAKKKKFSIWSDILQEEAIENQFLGSEFFGEGYRGKESYNYKLKHLMYENQEAKNSYKKSSLMFPRKKLKAFNKYKNINAKKSPLMLQSLDVTAHDPPEKVALDISKKLNEPNSDIIVKIVNTLGNEKAIEVFNKTQELEKNGGLLILNGSRRRTSGGVYLKLVKDENLSKENFEAIFKTSCEFHAANAKLKKNKPKGKGKKGSKTQANLKSLPFRYELELSMSNDENDTNVLKNPPPSPVYLSANSSNPFSLSDTYSVLAFSPANPSSACSTSPPSNSVTMHVTPPTQKCSPPKYTSISQLYNPASPIPNYPSSPPNSATSMFHPPTSPSHSPTPSLS